MSVILRVDDFPGTKPEEFWKHNLDNFKRFDAVLEKHGIEEYTLGVIPKHTTEEHIDWLAENPRVHVALHGIEHDERYPNEFRPYETEDEILSKMVSACAPLNRTNGCGRVRRYIPPHNVVDLKTCNALRRANFTTLFCGPGTDMQLVKSSPVHSMLEIIPSEFPVWYGRTDEMMGKNDTIERLLEESRLPGHHCLTLHWPWEWNIGLDNLDTFMGKVSRIFW